VGDQTVVGVVTRSAREVEPGDHHDDGEEAGAQPCPREEVRGARTDAQARTDPDEQDTQSEKRRLALERRDAGPHVTKASQAGQHEERANK